MNGANCRGHEGRVFAASCMLATHEVNADSRPTAPALSHDPQSFPRSDPSPDLGGPNRASSERTHLAVIRAGLSAARSRTWVDDMCHFAAKDRTFKTVRPNQPTASGTVPIRGRPSL